LDRRVGCQSELGLQAHKAGVARTTWEVDRRRASRSATQVKTLLVLDGVKRAVGRGQAAKLFLITETGRARSRHTTTTTGRSRPLRFLAEHDTARRRSQGRSAAKPGGKAMIGRNRPDVGRRGSDVSMRAPGVGRPRRPAEGYARRPVDVGSGRAALQHHWPGGACWRPSSPQNCGRARTGGRVRRKTASATGAVQPHGHGNHRPAATRACTRHVPTGTLPDRGPRSTARTDHGGGSSAMTHDCRLPRQAARPQHPPPGRATQSQEQTPLAEVSAGPKFYREGRRRIRRR